MADLMSVFGWVCTVQSREVGCRDGDGRPPAAWPRLRHFSQLLSPRKRVPPPGPASPIPTPPAGRCLCLGAPCLCLSAPGATNAMIVAVIVCSSYFTEQTHNVSDTCPHDVYPMVGGGCFVDMWDTTQGAVGQVSLDSMWRAPAGAASRSSPQEQPARAGAAAAARAAVAALAAASAASDRAPLAFAQNGSAPANQTATVGYPITGPEEDYEEYKFKRRVMVRNQPPSTRASLPPPFPPHRHWHASCNECQRQPGLGGWEMGGSHRRRLSRPLRPACPPSAGDHYCPRRGRQSALHVLLLPHRARAAAGPEHNV